MDTSSEAGVERAPGLLPGRGVAGSRVRSALSALVLAFPVAASAQLTVVSNVGTNTSAWNTAANWAPANVPDGASELAVLTNGTASVPITVLLNTTLTLGGFRQGADNTLTRDGTTARQLIFSAGDDTVFTNEGVIASGSAAVTSGTFTVVFTNGTYRNSGVFLATTGTTLGVTKLAAASGFTLDNTGASLVANSGGTLSLGSGIIAGGQVNANNGGALTVSGLTFLNGGVTVAGGARLTGTATFNGAVFTNGGAVRVGGSSSGNSSAIQLTNTVMVNAGTATVYIGNNGWSGADSLLIRGGGVLRNTGVLIVTNERVTVSGGTGSGHATIDIIGELVNDGTILVAGPNGYTSNDVTYATGYTQLRPTGGGSVWLTGTGTVYITPMRYDNNASPYDGISSIGVKDGGAILNIGTNQTIIARGSGPTTITGTGYQSLGLRVNNYGIILADGALGGPLSINPGGGYFNNHGALVATNAALLILSDSGKAFANFGALTVHAGCILSNTMSFTQSAGTTRVDGVLVSTSAVLTVAGGTFAGSGTVRGAVSIKSGATLAPGSPTGALTVTNAAVTLSNSTLAITLQGSAAHGLLRVVGTGASLILKGTNNVLDVALVGTRRWGTPTPFRIFEGSAVNTNGGRFGTLRWNGAALSNHYAVAYGADAIDIVVRPGPGTIIVVR